MNDLLQFVLDAHGGLERWQEVQWLNARMSVGGYLFELKSQPLCLRTGLIQARAGQPWMMISPLPAPGSRGLYEPGMVKIQSDDGNTVEELLNPRSSFEGHERLTPWSNLQSLYFLSYALWCYLTFPFYLASDSFSCEEAPQFNSDGDTWRVLKVIYPEGFDTHSTEQRYYFDADGMLRRHDYCTDVARARASQFYFDAREFDGFFFPTHSRVVWRDFQDRPKRNGPSSVWIELESLIISNA